MKKFQITVNGTSYDVEVNEVGGAAPAAPKATHAAPAPAAAPAAPKAAPAPKAAAPAPAGAATVTSPMPGKILSVAVQQGASVTKGQLLCVLEAMKMENEISAPQDGTVSDIRVSANQSVATGDVLIVLE